MFIKQFLHELIICKHAYSVRYVPVITYHEATLSQITMQVWILWLRQDLLTLD